VNTGQELSVVDAVSGFFVVVFFLEILLLFDSSLI
jgi:hypothetical protein